MKRLLVVFGIVLLSVTPAMAASFSVADIGDTLTVDFNGNVEGQNISGLSAQIDFTLVSFDLNDSNQVVVDVSVMNTSSAPITASRVSAFGFDSNPDVVSGTSTSGEFTTVITGGQFPNNFGNIEVCVIDNQNNCTGGGSSGVLIGDTENFLLTLNFADLTTSLTMNNFGVRYQSITGPGLNGASGPGTGTENENPPPPPPPPVPVPEPGSMILLGSGLLALARHARKRMRD